MAGVSIPIPIPIPTPTLTSLVLRQRPRRRFLGHKLLPFSQPVSRIQPMIQRYSRPVMREIWTEENKLRLWLQIELLASEALAKEGVVPADDFQILKAGMEVCLKDTKSLAERARE